jgi:hypothetical protein
MQVLPDAPMDKSLNLKKKWMKKIVLFLLLVGMISCKKEAKIDDTSLKINVTTATDACSCNDIAIAIMKEVEAIYSEAKKEGKLKLDSRLNQELMKRDAKHQEYYDHCKPIYELEGMGSKCSNYKEAEELDVKISKLRREIKEEE